MVLTIVICYIVCWTPYWCYQVFNYVYQHVIGGLQSEFLVVISHLVQIIAYMSSALNPFIYSYMSEAFRTSFRLVLESCKCCCCCLLTDAAASSPEASPVVVASSPKTANNNGDHHHQQQLDNNHKPIDAAANAHELTPLNPVVHHYDIDEEISKQSVLDNTSESRSVASLF